MVPLLEQTLPCLAWHSFAVEGIYMRGTESQSHGQCIYKMSHIFIRLEQGLVGQERLSCGFPPFHLVGREQGVKVVVLWVPTPPPLRKVTSPVIHIRIPISHWISPRGWQWILLGCIKFCESDLPGGDPPWAVALLIICKIPKVHL